MFLTHFFSLSFLLNPSRYVEPSKIQRATHGMLPGLGQLKTAPPKKGQTANTVGDGKLAFVPSPGVGCEYEDESRKYSRWRAENKALWREGTVFRYSSPMKESSCPGDMSGCFPMPKRVPRNRAYDDVDSDDEGPPPEDLYKEDEPAPRNRPPVVPKKKKTVFNEPNIRIKPPAKGGPGVAGTRIGGEEIEYIHEPYVVDRLKELASKERETHENKQSMGADRPVFLTASSTKECFDSQPHAAASAIYTDEDAPDSPEPYSIAPRTESLEMFRTGHLQTFITNHSGTFNKFPPHKDDPLDVHIIRKALLPYRRQPKKEADRDLPLTLKDRGEFLPSSGARAGATKPVLSLEDNPPGKRAYTGSNYRMSGVSPRLSGGTRFEGYRETLGPTGKPL